MEIYEIVWAFNFFMGGFLCGFLAFQLLIHKRAERLISKLFAANDQAMQGWADSIQQMKEMEKQLPTKSPIQFEKNHDA